MDRRLFLAVLAFVLALSSPALSEQQHVNGEINGSVSVVGALPVDKQLDFGQFTDFGEARVASIESIFSINPTYCTSVRDDTTTLNATGSIDCTQGEIRLRTGNDSDGRVVMQTKRKGLYIPGSVLIPGIDISTQPLADFTGSEVARGGYFDSENGFFVQYDDTGLALVRRFDGQDTVVRQQDWNIETLDGNGPSGVNYDPTTQTTIRFPFIHYGGGDAHVSFYLSDGEKMQLVTAHRFHAERQMILEDPNLPVRAEVDNGGDTSDTDTIAIGGRHVSRTNTENKTRENPVVVHDDGVTISDTDFVNVAVITRENRFEGHINSVQTTFQTLTVSTSGADVEYQVTTGDTIAGATFTTPLGYPDGEIATEVDQTVGGFTAEREYKVEQDYVLAGQGNSSGQNEQESVETILGLGEFIVLSVRSLDGTQATINYSFEYRERR